MKMVRAFESTESEDSENSIKIAKVKFICDQSEKKNEKKYLGCLYTEIKCVFNLLSNLVINEIIFYVST